jgi:hypothetical protein
VPQAAEELENASARAAGAGEGRSEAAAAVCVVGKPQVSGRAVACTERVQALARPRWSTRLGMAHELPLAPASRQVRSTSSAG